MSLALPVYLLLLPLGGLVVLMHLLRPRRKDVVVSSLMLWMRLAREVRSYSLGRRLAELLLVLVRTLVVVLTVLALAKPLVSLAFSPGDVLIVLDSSASMLARDESPTRFDKAREQAVRFLEGLTGRPTVTVVDAGPHPRMLVTRTRSRRSALAALARVQPCEAHADLDAAIDVAFSVVKPGEHDLVAVFTDGAYDAAAFLERFRAPGAPLLRVFKVGSQSSRNVGITSLEFRPDARTQDDAEGFAAISNFSTQDVEVDVSVKQDGRLLTSSRLHVPAGATSGFAFGYPAFPGTVCTAEVSPGWDLQADDVAQAVFPADTTVRVLMVGESSPPIVKAMQAIPQVSVKTAARTLPSPEGQPSDIDIIVYNNTPITQVSARGAILIGTFPNAGPAQGAPEISSPVVLDYDRAHPVMRFIDLSRVTIEKASIFPPPLAAHTLVESSAGPLVWTVERPGQRIITFSFDPKDSDLVERPSFPVLVRNIVGWLAPEKLDLCHVATRCGEGVEIRAAPGSKTLGITDPIGRITRIHDPPGQVTFSDTLYTGLYSVRDQVSESLFAANLASPEESNVTPRAVLPEPGPGEAGATRMAGGQRDATPLVLVAVLVLLALEWLITQRGKGPRLASMLARGRKWPAHLLRGAFAACVFLAATGVAIPVPTAVQSVMFVADRSGSISPAARRAQDRFIRASIGAMKEPDTFGIVAFGKEPHLECEVGPGRSEFAISSRPGEVDTNIESALRVALQALPPGPGRRIVLLSDGNETVGDALAAASEAATAGVPVDVVLPGPDTESEVAITSFVAPDVVSLGEPFELKIAVGSTRAAKAVITVHQNSALAVHQEVALAAGKNVFILPWNLAKPGLSAFECRITTSPGDDRSPENNAAFAHVTAWSRPRVLLASGREASRDLLRRILLAASMEVTCVPPDGIPVFPEIAGYDLLVLDDVPAVALSASQMSAIADYVRHFGGGLVASGGRNSFGLGAYRNTPLEDVLPVWSDVRERVAFPALTVVIVLDRSGSMATAQAGTSKLDLAREAAYSVAEIMNETDRIGVLAFDTECFWAVPIQGASRREAIAQGLSTLVAEGGTSLYPAMVEAHRKLAETPAMVKHLIVLSDGVSASASFEEISRKIASDGITITTVAVGQDSDIELMKNIADWGGGRAYYTGDIYAIPRILTTEALVISRSLVVEEPFVPSLGTPAPFLADIAWEECPHLEGYVATSLKDQARAHLVSAVGDPVLASWHAGLGRSVAFTSSMGPPWAQGWSSWKGAARLWAQVARWAARTRNPGILSAKAHISGGAGRLAVDAVDEDGGYLNFMALTATVLMPDGTSREVDLTQVGPGRYEGSFDAHDQGVYLAAVATKSTEADLQNSAGVALAGASFSCPEEYRRTDADLSLLHNIAATTHGKVLGPEEVAFGTSERAAVMYRPVSALLLTALALFLTYLAIATVPSDFRTWLMNAFELVKSRAKRARAPAGERPFPEERYEDLVWASLSRERHETPAPQWTGAGRVDDQGLDYATRVYFARLRKERAHEREESSPGRVS